MGNLSNRVWRVERPSVVEPSPSDVKGGANRLEIKNRPQREDGVVVRRDRSPRKVADPRHTLAVKITHWDVNQSHGQKGYVIWLL